MWADDEDDDDVIFVDERFPKKKSQSTASNSGKSTKKVSIGSWISSSFDGFDDFSTNSTQSNKTRKRPREVLPKSSQRGIVSRRSHVTDDELWADKHAPKSVTELAVHKKKIEEVQTWIEKSLDKICRGSYICLLTGPAGCGKTATVNTLKKDLRFEVQEWCNPVTSGSEAFTQGQSVFSPLGGYVNESQKTIFQDFLLRANKYPTLQIFGGDQFSWKVIVVEEFPNVFFRDVTSFHNILRKYKANGRCPLIFIVSDSPGGESTERLLFPKQIQTDLNITNISFNPVAQTSLTKVMTRIATVESTQGSHRFAVPSKTTIDALAGASNGDIRGAINTLQFACLKDTHDIEETLTGSKSASGTSRSNVKVKTKGDRKLTKKGSFSKTGKSTNELAAIGGKDSSLFLFRAVGKILHCKRTDPAEGVEEPNLPPHLAHHSRYPLLIKPEDVVEKCHLKGEVFTAYLQQNYMDFFTELDTVVSASHYLSDADHLLRNWQSRDIMRDYASSVATRGLMFCKSARLSGGHSGPGWKPLHKPQLFTTNQKAQGNSSTARMLFRKFWATPKELQTELLPYLGVINVTLHDPGQIAFLHEVTRFPVFSFSTRSAERLDEKDVEEMDSDESKSSPTDGATRPQTQGESIDETDFISTSQSNVNVSVLEDEEFNIEDFDDEDDGII